MKHSKDSAVDPVDLIREGKIKRYFRGKRKLDYPNLVSHIIQRAAGKDLLFIEDRDYLYMLVNMKSRAPELHQSLPLCRRGGSPVQRSFRDSFQTLL